MGALRKGEKGVETNGKVKQTPFQQVPVAESIVRDIFSTMNYNYGNK